jgi:DNA-binding transcriptional ArsR family regulator
VNHSEAPLKGGRTAWRHRCIS